MKLYKAVCEMPNCYAEKIQPLNISAFIEQRFHESEELWQNRKILKVL